MFDVDNKIFIDRFKDVFYMCIVFLIVMLFVCKKKMLLFIKFLSNNLITVYLNLNF